MFDLYDEYCHGRIDRREFLTHAAAVTVGGLAMAQALLPRYARAQTISFTDQRIKARYVTYPSPGGTLRARCAATWCSRAGNGAVPDRAGDPREPRPQSLHRGRGAPRGGRGLPGAGARRPVPGRRLSRATTTTAARCRPSLDQAKLRTDMLNSARYREGARALNGKLGVTGFCWGGGTTNFLAATLGADMQAAVPFYGAAAETAVGAVDQGAAADPVRRERRAHQRHVAGLRGGAEGGRTCRYEMHIYPGTQHGFHNNSTPRYHEAAGQARLGPYHCALQEVPRVKRAARWSLPRVKRTSWKRAVIIVVAGQANVGFLCKPWFCGEYQSCR